MMMRFQDKIENEADVWNSGIAIRTLRRDRMRQNPLMCILIGFDMALIKKIGMYRRGLRVIHNVYEEVCVSEYMIGKD
jgi:hypothetical protein